VDFLSAANAEVDASGASRSSSFSILEPIATKSMKCRSINVGDTYL